MSKVKYKIDDNVAEFEIYVFDRITKQEVLSDKLFTKLTPDSKVVLRKRDTLPLYSITIDDIYLGNSLDLVNALEIYEGIKLHILGMSDTKQKNIEKLYKEINKDNQPLLYPSPIIKYGVPDLTCSTKDDV